MERRFVLFITLSFAILIGHLWLMNLINPPPKRRAQPPKDAEVAAEEPAGQPKPAAAEKQPAPEPGAAEPGKVEKPVEQPVEKPAEEIPQVEVARQWVTLGSADPQDPYRMLVTLTNKGAAVARIELSSARFRDLEFRGGYLGHLVIDEKAVADAVPGRGCPVQVVGRGTPAHKAGLKPGDVIQAIGKQKVKRAKDLDRILDLPRHRPGREVVLSVIREGKAVDLTVKLTRKPLEVTRPESTDPLSFLFTLSQIDKLAFPDPALEEAAEEEEEEQPPPGAVRPKQVNRELPGVELRAANWEVIRGPDADRVTFRRRLPKFGLEVLKTYRLKKLSQTEIGNRNYKAYHLVYGIEIRNIGQHARQVAYQQDGPTGLPTEGWWYANKIGRDWGAVGLRDLVVSHDPNTFLMLGCPDIAEDEYDQPYEDKVVTFIGIDAQYFSAVMIPKKQDQEFATWQPLRVGRVPPDLNRLTNTSCRLTSHLHSLPPGGSLSEEYTIFAGPKRPPLLAEYGLDELVYYGWFGWLAVPMVKTLHFFHDYVVFTYGLAILMLTVVVRGCMFPLSRKQALGAQKMQELQPEIKKLQEKHKKDMEARTKAQQELFRKHNYNPLSGCLVLFIQLPIFIALYRSLMVDIELRQAPLLTERIRWCSNLAAPDMLLDWSGFMPGFITSGVGILGLGPYFNLLPILTVVLFVVQQKMFMPPPADEQAAMQQKIMKYMMLFIGLLFFKVASGLCVYFIASSLWGLAERKFLPKTTPAAPAAGPQTRADAKARAREQARAEARRTGNGRDGSPAAGKKKKDHGKRR